MSVKSVNSPFDLPLHCQLGELNLQTSYCEASVYSLTPFVTLSVMLNEVSLGQMTVDIHAYENRIIITHTCNEVYMAIGNWDY